ncbi:MAG: nucleotidyl transferase AbiEii/AbiGii toxin family protein, partial [Lachnospiraceae bacterium]|nr:nucleotidyl transferase AbiEii/AbiGii toxin family protein [Lachnospiraceae bacterium]
HTQPKTTASTIPAAFRTGNTKEHLLLFYPNEQVAGGITNNEVVKIKFEVDVNPPKYAAFEHKYRLLPAPYEVNLYDMPSLFAGKVHAVLCRSWQSRIKGRDLYDYVFYLTRGTSVNQKHLRERLLQSGFITQESAYSLEEIKTMLSKRFDSIDYAQAKLDVEPFIRDTSALDVWCADFFKQITEELTVC